ncbi:MAG: bile acid:sodium symporter family protein [Pirellulales bacterium]
MISLLRQRWFLFALAGVITVGFTFSVALEPLSQMALLRNGIVITVLFLMSFPLQFGDLRKAVQKPGGALLASGLNYGFMPILAWIFSLSMTGDLAIGLNLAAATPCTLASAAVWTRKAGGNDATALMVTIITNLSCFVITPLCLLWTTGQAVEIKLERMIFTLGLMVLVPLAVGQLLRIPRPLGTWATLNKARLGIVAQIGVLSIVFLGCIKSGLNLRELPPEESPHILSFVWMIFAVLAVHSIGLLIAHKIAKRLKFSRPERIAIGFASSQKTLMVGLLIAATYYEASPLAILPMVTFHVGQLLIDTIVADRMKQNEPPAEESGQVNQEQTS